MKVLILGSGGREHALAWAVKRSQRVSEVVCAPGNGGMAEIARCVPVDLKDVAAMVAAGGGRAAGADDCGSGAAALAGRGGCASGARTARLRADAGGGDAGVEQRLRQALLAAAQDSHRQLRGLHQRRRDRKGDRLFPSADCGEGRRAARRQGRHHLRLAPHGHGGRRGFAQRASCWARRSRTSSSRSFWKATRSAFSAWRRKTRAVPLAPAQDHKRIGEGDTGPNTGGMGVYSTDAMLDAAMTEWILHHIAEPTVRGMAEEGDAVCGRALLRADDDRARPAGAGVQCPLRRSGDAGDSDAPGERSGGRAGGLRRWQAGRERSCDGAPGASACVVASSSGYPGKYKTGLPITGLADAAKLPEVQVFHAGFGSSRRPSGHRRRARAGCDRRCAVAGRGAGPRLRGHQAGSLRWNVLSQRHRPSCAEEEGIGKGVLT